MERAKTSLIYLLAGIIVGLVFFGPDDAKIGGDTVPSGLTCQEDEVIGYDPTDSDVHRPLTCVHYETLENAR